MLKSSLSVWRLCGSELEEQNKTNKTEWLQMVGASGSGDCLILILNVVVLPCSRLVCNLVSILDSAGGSCSQEGFCTGTVMGSENNFEEQKEES